MEDSEAKQGFKIKDRRRFDSSGNEIDSGDQQEKPGQQEQKAPRAAAEARGSEQPRPRPAESPRQEHSAPQRQTAGAAESEHDLPLEGDPEEGISFHSFIMSLAHQALMLLGEIPGPDGRAFPADKPAAKQTIDILSMLEHKTKGNLTVEEKHFLEEILHELRLRFVRG